MTTQPLKPNQYRCEMCNGVFESGRSDEEAQAELKRDFGDVAMKCCVIICDDCYQKTRPDRHPEEFQTYKAGTN